MARKKKQIEKITEVLENLSYTELIAIYKAICKIKNKSKI